MGSKKYSVRPVIRPDARSDDRAIPTGTTKNMKEIKPVWHSLGHAILVVLYITIVGTIMQQGNRWFGTEDKFWTPVAVLSLFVLSAAVTGSLVLGRPVLMYLDGQKREALQFFGYTVFWLALLTVLVFIVLGLSK